jgi:CheY-like chemotaxis protein
LSRPHILIVDDDSEIRAALADVLKDEGFDVLEVPDSAQALQWLRSHPDERCLVLLDLMMPVMNGWNFLDVRQNDPSLRHFQVIVFTGSGVCGLIRRRYTITDCLPKPFDLQQLLRVIRAWNN